MHFPRTTLKSTRAEETVPLSLQKSWEVQSSSLSSDFVSLCEGSGYPALSQASRQFGLPPAFALPNYLASLPGKFWSDCPDENLAERANQHGKLY